MELQTGLKVIVAFIDLVSSIVSLGLVLLWRRNQRKWIEATLRPCQRMRLVEGPLTAISLIRGRGWIFFMVGLDLAAFVAQWFPSIFTDNRGDSLGAWKYSDDRLCAYFHDCGFLPEDVFRHVWILLEHSTLNLNLWSIAAVSCVTLCSLHEARTGRSFPFPLVVTALFVVAVVPPYALMTARLASTLAAPTVRTIFSFFVHFILVVFVIVAVNVVLYLRKTPRLGELFTADVVIDLKEFIYRSSLLLFVIILVPYIVVAVVGCVFVWIDYTWRHSLAAEPDPVWNAGVYRGVVVTFYSTMGILSCTKCGAIALGVVVRRFARMRFR